jgi:hypothetical protein
MGVRSRWSGKGGNAEQVSEERQEIDMQYSSFEGGCLCGSCRYRITGPPRSSSVCFCRSCRLASGAASVAWFVVRTDQFVLLTGSLIAFQSSPPVTRSFCSRCGTPLMYQHADDLNAVEITTATLDDPNAFPPTREIWHSLRIPWAASNPAIPHFAHESVSAGA